MRFRFRFRVFTTAIVAGTALFGISGCAEWRGLNSLPLPGTEGKGPGAFEVQIEMPDVNNLQQNSRVRVADVTVGNVTRIRRQGWHALVTVHLNADVDLPQNATARLGQTSLLGSQHVELAAPKNERPQGRLHDGSVVVGRLENDHAFIAREPGSGTREVTDNYFRQAGVDPASLKVLMELGSPEALKGVVSTGLGVAIVSRASFHKELQLQHLVAIPLLPRLTRPLSLVTPKEKFRSKLVTSFVDFARRKLQEYAA